jgi:hypothetical protein
MVQLSRRVKAALGTAFLVGALSGAAQAQSPVFKLDAPSGGTYFDATSGTATFDVTAGDMAGGTAVNSVTIAIDFEKYDGETMGVNAGGTPFYNEISFILTNPQNVSTTLIGSGVFNASSGGFRGVITFDDLASSFVNVDPNNPQAGAFKPSGPGLMGDLLSADGVGTWTLAIADTAGGDHLGYYSAELSLNGGTAAAPEPGTLALSLLGVGGLFLRRRKSL